MIKSNLKELITKIKEIDTIVDLSVGKVLTMSDALSIYSLTNDLISQIKLNYLNYDNLAEHLKNEFGESLVDEDKEEDAYNWWLQDVTVEEIITLLKEYKNN